MMKTDGRKFSVIGMGRSGLAAATALAARGGDVLLSDGRDTEELRRLRESHDPAIQWSFGREEIRPGDVVVLSPGIPPSSPIFRHAYRVADQVMGEVELFYRLFPGTIVAITGTDGKSTVTTLLAHLLQEGGHQAIAAGNLGNALCGLLDTATEDTIAVAEVSCFQLITTTAFRPKVAIITNLAEDHLDYHGNMTAYVAAKGRVLRQQAAGDTFIRNIDDPIIRQWARPDNPTMAGNGQGVLNVSQKGAVDDGFFMDQGHFALSIDGQVTHIAPRDNLLIPGRHNTENGLLALAGAWTFGVAPQDLARGLLSYQGLPHRIEPVGILGGVRFFNDSKATNPHAATTGLRAFDEPVVLIAGGFEKNLPLGEMASAVHEHCKAVVLTGDSSARMLEAFRGPVAIHVVNSMEEAVKEALNLAKPRGTVLLSPGASSFDRYAGFEERGDHFRSIVQQQIQLEDIRSRTC